MSQSTPSPQRARRRLQRLLRFLGGLDLLACVVTFLPARGIETLHHLAGLGTFPSEPIAGYLARNVSTLVAIHGLVLWFVARDVDRYRELIRFLGIVSVLHGGLLVGIDLVQGLPGWWVVAEGPVLAGLGGAIVWLERGLA